MFSQFFKTSSQFLPAGCAVLVAIAMGATQVGGQDTISTTSGPQANSALPPPTPSDAAMQPTPQVNSDDPATLDAAQNTARSLEEPRSNQTLTPPQPTQDMRETAANARAELGVFLVPANGPGVQIRNVTPGSAAEAAGLRSGDFLLAVNGQNVETPQEVGQFVRQHQPGDAIELRFWRDGSEQTIAANLQEARQLEVQSAGVMESPAYYEIRDGRRYYPSRRVYRPNYGYVPGTYYGYPYTYGYPYRYEYYGTPRFGYYDGPWGEGVRVGPFQFGWR
jgi:hypothetical protein